MLETTHQWGADLRSPVELVGPARLADHYGDTHPPSIREKSKLCGARKG